MPKKERLLTEWGQKLFRGIQVALGGCFLVPEVGIEPTRTQGSLDFESSASTSFTTPAKDSNSMGDLEDIPTHSKSIIRDYIKIVKGLSISY
jgi:hypothetical protein